MKLRIRTNDRRMVKLANSLWEESRVVVESPLSCRAQEGAVHLADSRLNPLFSSTGYCN